MLLLSYAGTFSLLLLRNGWHYVNKPEMKLVLDLVPAVVVIFATGLMDDLIGLKPWHKLAGQFAAAGLAFAGGVQIHMIGGASLSWLSLPLTLVWIAGCSNAFNLIDGLDGLACGIGIFATSTMALAAVINGFHPLLVATLPLLGTLLGFLRYNFNPASIFLGDCGSLLIGFLLACFGVIWSHKTTTALGMTAPLMALALPVLDVSLAIARRYLRLQPIFNPDRGHIHHMLLASGCGPRHTALIMYAACAVAALMALAQNSIDSGFGVLLILVFCALAWIGVNRLRYVEFAVVQRMLSKGELRRILNSRIRLQMLEDSLKKAQSFADCWPAIRETGRELGIVELEAKMHGETFFERLGGAEEAAWEFCLSFGESSWLRVIHAGTGYPGTVMVSFLEVIEKQLHAKPFVVGDSAGGEMRISGVPRARGVGAGA